MNKILLLFLFAVLLYILFCSKTSENYNNYERLYKRFQEDISLENPKNLPVQRYLGNTRYLYPLTNDKYCDARGLKSALSPELCCTKNRCDYRANCRCVNKHGVCEICFSNIHIENPPGL